MIFDSLIRFHQAEENSATEMSEVMANLRRLAAAGATALGQHHKSRAEGSTYRGSSDIHGSVDVAFSIDRDAATGLLAVRCFKNRFKPEFNLTVKPELEDGRFSLTEAPELLKSIGEVNRLKEVIAANPGIAQGELIREAGLAEKHGRAILHDGVGIHWQVEPGAHGKKGYFQLGSLATHIPCQAAKLGNRPVSTLTSLDEGPTSPQQSGEMLL
jgi:hypothetical protein